MAPRSPVRGMAYRIVDTSSVRPRGRSVFSVQPTLALASITYFDGNIFVTASNSRNSVQRPFRMRPVQRVAFEGAVALLVIVVCMIGLFLSVKNDFSKIETCFVRSNA